MSAYKTIFGYRVWPASILKVYYPFMLSATTIYFLFSGAHFAMMNSSTDKWANLVTFKLRRTSRKRRRLPLSTSRRTQSTELSYRVILRSQCALEFFGSKRFLEAVNKVG
ncbi:hypothetical protein DFJ73DRAFT_132611 [Zopfochytrium polystomum]|nr:hypothetical protein DFJ73DRAFT_132611 [Zopfochytrium polystomum]